VAFGGLSRANQVAHFFRQVVGAPVITKETLSQRTGAYQGWVEASARTHRTPIRWAEKGCAKRTMSCPGSAECSEGRLRRVLHFQEHGWSARPSVSPCRNVRPRTPTIASSPTSGVASLTNISTSTMKYSARSRCVSLRSSLQNHLLPQRSQLHRASAQTRQDRLPQERQRLCGATPGTGGETQGTPRPTTRRLPSASGNSPR
jgi:hypothetical protein